MLARLGEVPDRVIAQELGASVKRVRSARRALGIEQYSNNRPWTEAEQALLGTAPDRVIAEHIERPLSIP